MRSILFALSVMSFMLVAPASLAQVMDFEDFPDTAACPDGANGVIQNGLSIVDDTPIPPNDPDSCVLGAANEFPDPPGVPTNGTTVFGWCGDCNPTPLTLTLTRQDAAPFNLVSIDFSRFPAPESGTVNITGFPAGGGAPVLVQHTIDSDDWITVDLSALSNVERVELQNTGPSVDSLLDNIITTAASSASASPAPVPVMGLPVLWLLGTLTMLLALVSLRGRQR